MMPDNFSQSDKQDQNTSRIQPIWGIEYKLLACERCKWVYLVKVEVNPQNCPACFHQTLVPITNIEKYSSNYPPELVIPFSASESLIIKNLESFASGIPYAPEDLNYQALNQRLQRIYLPAWLVDGDVYAEWSAEAGFYYDALSHLDHFDDNTGGWVSRQVTEKRIRWEPRLGRLRQKYQNIPGPALQESDVLLQQQLETFNTQKTQPYQASILEEAIVRLPDRPQEDAWTDVQPAFQATAMEECRLACEADQIRQFRWQPEYQNLNWTLLLLPLFSTFYQDDDGQTQKVMIHGQTGQLTGQKRGSMKRAQKASLNLLIAAGVIFIIGLILTAIAVILPPLFALAGILLFVAILIGVGTVIPIWRVWVYNRN